jgi:hypothetical protein
MNIGSERPFVKPALRSTRRASASSISSFSALRPEELFERLVIPQGFEVDVAVEADAIEPALAERLPEKGDGPLLRRGGDSLQGRYHDYRLHPFSLAELLGDPPRLEVMKEIPVGDRPHPEEFEALFKFGGFPEPLFRADERLLRRWHNEKIERMVREEITEIEQVRDLGRLKLLSDMLPARVGSLLSVNALREELEVSHRAVSSWLGILETFYYQFGIHPYVGKALRSIKKQPKLYLWDWSEVDDHPARFENLVAAHLLKACHYLHDREGHKAALHFLRNVDKKEVDFLVTVDQKPWFAVETKLSERSVSPSLLYYQERLKIPFVYQVIREPGAHRFMSGVRVISADRFLAGLV